VLFNHEVTAVENIHHVTMLTDQMATDQIVDHAALTTVIISVTRINKTVVKVDNNNNVDHNNIDNIDHVNKCKIQINWDLTHSKTKHQSDADQ